MHTNMSKKIKASIVGANGYTGAELLRLLAHHPYVDVLYATSRQEKGRLVKKVLPHLMSYPELCFSDPKLNKLFSSDVVFFATPHGVSMRNIPALLEQGVKVIDLSADFRMQDTVLWEQWYKQPHEATAYVKEAVYGLAELNRERIKQARLVACPGCYATAVLLGLLPLLENKVLAQRMPIIADCKSGISGAGKNAKIDHLFTEITENFQAYGLQGHRHQPEIEQIMFGVDNSSQYTLIFVPQLLPIARGMQANLYVTLEEEIDLRAVMADYYEQADFVTVLSTGIVAQTKQVRGTNHCLLSVFPLGNRHYLLISVIDNLVKGAAGQAVQNMNILFGFDEQCGLQNIPVWP